VTPERGRPDPSVRRLWQPSGVDVVGSVRGVVMVRRMVGAVVVASVLVAGAVGCSSDDGDTSSAEGGRSTTQPSDTTGTPSGDGSGTAPERPDGPAATVDRELTEGSPFLAAGVAADLDAAGYVEHEYQVSGTAVAYEGDMPDDGAWDLAPTGETGDYTTRIVVRRPAAAADANGTVLVEWLNVSGGVDANPDFAYLAEEILRGGYTWVGVSAQHIGIEGGPTAVSLPGAEALTGQGLVKLAPDRYGDLTHPGDQYAYDLYTQVGRAVRAGADDLLGGIEPERVVAVGESQSAFALTTYANGVQPLTRAFDGFFIHSRGGPALPLAPAAGQAGMDIAGSLTGEPTTIRTDLDVPVLQFQTESDVDGILGFARARQDDTDLIRTWEVAGTAHVDRFMLGPIADTAGCEPDVNAGPHGLVAKAALRALQTWLVDGTPPPGGPRLRLDGDLAIVRDDDGIALGGIRTPLVDTPVDALRGDAAPGASVFCLLAGRTIPLDADALAARYPDRAAYLDDFEAAADEAIDAGFVLPDDRDALLALAQPDRIT